VSEEAITNDAGKDSGSGVGVGIGSGVGVGSGEGEGLGEEEELSTVKYRLLSLCLRRIFPWAHLYIQQPML
jgi:hypothetical protein